MLNPVMAYNASFAIQVAERLKPYGLRWLEESLVPNDQRSYIELKLSVPCITTEWLLLRLFETSDTAKVQKLAGNRDIASTTLNIPHSYKDKMAEIWIATHQQKFEC